MTSIAREIAKPLSQRSKYIAIFFGVVLVLGVLISKPGLDWLLIVDSSHHNAVGVKTLLEFGADPNSRHASTGLALIRASEQGDTEIVQSLLKAGADPNSQATGKTALICAVESGHVDTVSALLTAGADPNLFDSSDNPPLRYAETRPTMIPILVKAGAKETGD